MREVIEWKPVSDGLPEEYEDVLVTYGNYISIAHHNGLGSWNDEAGVSVKVVSHWAKLPMGANRLLQAAEPECPSKLVTGV